MTADERLELLLNRANQTLSELKRNHTARERVPALEAVKAYRGLKPKEVACEWDYEEYILHLTDVIDVMETALTNVLGENDYLIQGIKDLGGRCCDCLYKNIEGCLPDDDMSCYETYEFGGIREDWRADDD